MNWSQKLAMLRRTTSWKRIITFVVILLWAQVVVACAGPETADTSSIYDLVVLLSGLCAFLFWFCTPSHEREPLMGLKVQNRFSQALGLALAMTVVYYGLALVPCYAMGYVSFKPNMAWLKDTDGMVAVRWAVPAILVGSFLVFFINKLLGEELVFRGYLMGIIERLTNLPVSIAITSLLFTLWHLPYYLTLSRQIPLASSYAIRFAWLFIGSVSVCLLFAATRNLYAVSIYHALVNLKANVLLRIGVPGAYPHNGESMLICEVTNEEVFATFQLLALISQLVFALCVCFAVSKRKAVLTECTK